MNVELEGKGPDGKDRASAKKSKVTSGNLSKAGESAKAASGSGNDGASQRCSNLKCNFVSSYDLLLENFFVSIDFQSRFFL